MTLLEADPTPASYEKITDPNEARRVIAAIAKFTDSGVCCDIVYPATGGFSQIRAIVTTPKKNHEAVYDHKTKEWRGACPFGGVLATIWNAESGEITGNKRLPVWMRDHGFAWETRHFIWLARSERLLMIPTMKDVRTNRYTGTVVFEQ